MVVNQTTQPLILVADDDNLLREWVCLNLEGFGFSTLEANNGQKAVEIFKESLPDIVLMDVNMPVMDGFAACLEIKERWPDHECSIIFVTGLQQDEQTIGKAFDAGGDEFITKPINLNILKHRINKILNLREEISRTHTANEESRKFARVVESNASMVIITDTTGTINYVNEQFTEITGYSKDEVIGKNPKILKSGNQSTTFYKELWETILAGKSWRGEFVNQKKDGSTYISGETIFPVTNSSGAIAYFASTSVDITEIKKAQQRSDWSKDSQNLINKIMELSLEKNLLKDFLERTIHLIFSMPWLPDQVRGSVLLLNEHKNELSTEVQVGLSEELFTSCSNVPVGTCLCGEAISSKSIVFFNGEDKHQINCGGTPPRGNYCVPLVEGDKILGVLNIVLDVTHQQSDFEERLLTSIGHAIAGAISKKRIEERTEGLLRELEFQKLALDEHAIVSATNVHGNITYVNDKFVTISGYSREELIGQNHRMVKSDEHPPEFYQELWKTISNGKPWHGEVKNLTKKG